MVLASIIARIMVLPCANGYRLRLHEGQVNDVERLVSLIGFTSSSLMK